MEIVYFVVFTSVSVAMAFPQYHNKATTHFDSPSATILRQENNNIGLGDYQFLYQTSDGISREEKAELRTVGSNKAVVVQGSYSYIGIDGVTYTVNYVADENGYRAVGSHIPKN